MAKKCQKLYFPARRFKNRYFYAKNIIGLVIKNQKVFKNSLKIFGEIMCVFDWSVSLVKNMTMDFFAFYHRFLMTFLQNFSQSERHLHCMSTETAFGSFLKLPDVSVIPQIVLILQMYFTSIYLYLAKSRGENDPHGASM